MIRFQIPQQLVPAFRSLVTLTDAQVEQLVIFLKELPLGMGPKTFRAYFKDKVISKDETIQSEIGQLLFSLGGFKETEGQSLKEQMAALAQSAREESQEMSDEQVVRLQAMLEKLIVVAGTAQATYKAFVLLAQNERVVRDSNIVSDLRLVFDKELANKERPGIVIHQLRINAEVDNQPKEFYFNMTLTDLNNLQEQITRAVEKERLITADYAGTIEIIKIKD